MTKKRLSELEEELQYYKSKCASLEEGLFKADREISMLKNTIRRNEDHIQRLTHEAEWKNTSKK